MTGKRLAPEDRRRQLVGVGAEMFAAQPYDDVLMEEVAERADISRALLYKYFPSKASLFAAVYREAADGLLDATELSSDVPFPEQLRAGLERHFDYFAANKNSVLAANRTLAGDPIIQAIIVGELAVLRQRILDRTGLAGHQRALLATVLTAWLTFVRALVVDWLDTAALSREELTETCLGALYGALGDLAPLIKQ